MATPKGKSNLAKTPVKRFVTNRELIVKVKSEAGLRATGDGVRSDNGSDVSAISNLLKEEGIKLQPLFGFSEENIRYKAFVLKESKGVNVPDLSVYYYVNTKNKQLDEIASKLQMFTEVEAAYVKPSSEIPYRSMHLATQTPEAPPITPNFVSQQGYLNPAPNGIDAYHAWKLPGGGGKGINIIDLEWAWRFSHEDLLKNQGGVVGGTPADNMTYSNHGTAVIGEIGGDRTDFGITGICPDANISAVAFSMPTAAAIRLAADKLNPGDIMLLEVHRAGPRYNFKGRRDQLGYIAIEWWPDDFDAIRYAVSKGIIVVEAAGNGAENLSDPIYNVRPAGFPTTWKNPFNRSNRDSGAIIVGAGAPPPGTNGQDLGPARSRLDFSNYGSVVDAQGWGACVTTCGYGDLQGGNSPDVWYTRWFSGTSSASPIVVGALGCVQGILKAAGKALLTPETARKALRATGSAQKSAADRPATQRIGKLPDLMQLTKYVLEGPPQKKKKQK